MGYEKIYDGILKCDRNIRYEVYDFGEAYEKMRLVLKNYLSREETDVFITCSLHEWSSCKKL